MWPGGFCAPRIFVKATCAASQPELEVQEKRGRVPALRVETCPVTGQSTSLGTTGYVDGEPRRWRSPVVKSPRGADPAWSGPRRASEGTKNPQSPKEMTPTDETFDPEKDWNALHENMESEGNHE